MRRLGAAVLLAAALTPLTAVTASSPAHAGEVDITPPAVGSCHDLTYDEYLAWTEPDAEVDCSARHTSVTIKVKEFSTPPNWNEWPRIVVRMYVPCLESLVAATGGRSAQVQMTAYGLTFYKPTKAQRDAGAAWVRCDAVLHGGTEALAPVPADIQLEGDRPPLNVRKCRLSERADFALTVCSRRHVYISTWTFRMRGDDYPGERVARRFAYRKCENKLGSDTRWNYEWVASKLNWRAGLRSAVCSPYVG
jgi:hypothetical protein